MKRLQLCAALVTAGTAVIAGAVAPSAGAATHSGSGLPTIRVSGSGKSFSVHVPSSVTAGRVRVVVSGGKTGAAGSLVRFASGYSFAQYRADYIKTNQLFGKSPKKAIALYDSVLKKVDYLGGPDAQPGKHTTMTVVLKPGRYTIFDDNGNSPRNGHPVVVTGPSVKRAAPASSATVRFLPGSRFGGAKTIPAHGTISIVNADTKSPHMFVLQQVKPGTTMKQIIAALQSESNKPPAFALPGGTGSDSINPGNRVTLTYSVPAGSYVELCFQPDPKTGMPHALMGMVRLVTAS